MQYIQQPRAIEAKSFDIIGEIINETRPEYQFASPLHEAIVKRVIHTTADFDWLDILWFSGDALEKLCAALSRPTVIYTDTTMALSGINKTLLAKMGASAAATSAIRAWWHKRKRRDHPFNGGGGYCCDGRE